MRSNGNAKGKGVKGMIFLENHHPILKNLVEENLNSYIHDQSGNRAMEPIDLKVGDFDGVSYHVQVSDNNTNVMTVSLFMNGFRQIQQAGADSAINSTYGKYLTNATNNADLTLRIDAATVSANNVEQIADTVGLLKRNIMAAPFNKAFNALASGNASSVKPCLLPFRSGDQMVIVPAGDRVTVAVSFSMQEESDKKFAEQMLDMIGKASKHSNGPNVKFSKDIPAEVSRVNGVQTTHSTVGFLVYTVNKSHIGAGNLDNVVDLILTARQYVHYHIKASKAHLHQRMRAKVKYFLQVLNRAKPEQKKRIKKYREIKP